MNWDRIAGNWAEFKSRIRERWARLTDEDLTHIAGQRDRLMSVLQERYGWVREQSERQIKDFEGATDAAAGAAWSAKSSMDDEDEESMKSR